MVDKRVYDKEIVSREYRIYKEEETWRSLPNTIYEKAAEFSGKILDIEPDPKTKKLLQGAIDFSHLRVRPEDVASLTILFTLIICLPTLLAMLMHTWFGLPGPDIGLTIFIIGLSIPLAVFLYLYPLYQKKRFEMQAGGEIINMILYMGIFMRNRPNLEGATDFAAKNLTGPLAYEIRKLMWDVQVGNFTNIQEALRVYTSKWTENKEFVEAIELMAASLQHTDDKRIALIDEAINIILDGARENAKHYTQKIRMPIMMVHALGILLPVMGLVLFPIISVFLGVEPFILFLGYDLVLPLSLYFIIQEVLKTRPATFSRIILEKKETTGKFPIKVGKKVYQVPLIWIAVAITFFISGASFLISDPIFSAIMLLAGPFTAGSVYYLLSALPNLAMRDKTRNIEREFTEALFQLGNRISTGVPIEMAIESSMHRIANLKIKDLFLRALNNMKNFGMTFGDAFFNDKYGAIKFYPSELVKTIMRVIVESGKKGVSTAAIAMMSVSRYLKGLHNTQEEVNEQMGEVLSSMKFQSLFLSPMISGVVTTLAIVIIQILGEVARRLTQLGDIGSLGFFATITNLSISPYQFILIVGIYILETTFILSLFINGIENGEDRIGYQYILGYTLITSFIVFAISLFVTLSIFGPLVFSVLVS